MKNACITTLCEFKRPIDSIFVKSETEIFVNFEQRQMIYFDATRAMNWKKDFYESRMLFYSPTLNLAFVQMYEKQINVGKFENKKFTQILQIKWDLCGWLKS